MEKIVEQLFEKKIIEQALSYFSLDKNYKKLGDFENYVYEVKNENKTFILRITHNSHRSKNELIAELDWMNYLHNSAINVPKAYKSVNGLMVVPITASDGSEFFCSLFSKVDGKPVRIKDDTFNEKLFFAWGKTIGKIHQATEDYTLKKGIINRPSWNEDDLLTIENYIPVAEKVIIENTNKLIDTLHSLPKDNSNFGLIHGDIHSGNFFFDGEAIHVFDFDDSCYHWLVSDIAIPLYYSSLYRYPEGDEKKRNNFAKTFLSAFMAGYETERNAPNNWKEQISLFLKLRDITLYSVLHKKISKEERKKGWIADLLSEIKPRIENNRAIVDIN